MENRILNIYELLLKQYGPQGWWPLLDCKGGNPTKTGSLRGYHPGDYSYPKNKEQRFEICAGAILTQNTAWPNVEKALLGLRKQRLLSAKALHAARAAAVQNCIRPAGYFKQKAKKLKVFSDFFLSLTTRIPSRDELLALWGIGPETADSMLLYAYKKPEFVIDAYTKRVFIQLGMIRSRDTYDKIKSFFQKKLPKDVRLYQELHALIVEHAKRCYSKKPYGKNCFLTS